MHSLQIEFVVAWIPLPLENDYILFFMISWNKLSKLNKFSRMCVFTEICLHLMSANTYLNEQIHV